jgi:N-acetylglucosamine malate deacetylase 1
MRVAGVGRSGEAKRMSKLQANTRKFVILTLTFFVGIAMTQPCVAQRERRTILAIGAHAADMELTAGALLAHQAKLGDRVVLLHLTLGEGGNPKMALAAYAQQKRREAEAVARDLGAEVIFGPYADGLLPDDEQSRRYVAEVIRRIKPNYVITHWHNSIHQDHRVTSEIVKNAILMASLDAVTTDSPPYRGVRSLYFAENWEDAEGFQPYLYVDVSDSFDVWTKAIRNYEMVRGGIVPFAYFEFYTSLEKMRGALSGKKYAVAFDVEEQAKKVVIDGLR